MGAARPPARLPARGGRWAASQVRGALGQADPAEACVGISADMFEAMERGELTALYVIGENPAQSEADATRALHLLGDLEHLVVQDMFLTATAGWRMWCCRRRQAGANPRAR